jgi:hypothetical protein
MEPDFFVPPVIGPLYLKRTLSTGGVRAINRIERLAREIDAVTAAARARDPARAAAQAGPAAVHAAVNAAHVQRR